MPSDALFWHRLQFAFTLVFHYLFPVLTMGLALLIVIMKAIALRARDPHWDDLARFWIRIFGVNFTIGVVTGIPMEFQFGTNWARLSTFASPIIGQTLALAGLLAAFLGSRRGRDGLAFAGTSAFLAGLLVATAACLHPALLAAAPDPARSLTTFNTAAPAGPLAGALAWYVPGLVLAACYPVLLARIHRARVRGDEYGGH